MATFSASFIGMQITMDKQGRTIIRRNVRDGVAESVEILQPGQGPSTDNILATFFQKGGSDWADQAGRDAQHQREMAERQREMAEHQRKMAEHQRKMAEHQRKMAQHQREAVQRSQDDNYGGVVVRANGNKISVGCISGGQKAAIRVNGKSYATIGEYEANTGDMSFHNANISVRIIGAGARVGEWPLGLITDTRKVIAQLETDCGRIFVYDNDSLLIRNYIGPPLAEVSADNCSNIETFVKHLRSCGVNVTSVNGL